MPARPPDPRMIDVSPSFEATVPSTSVVVPMVHAMSVQCDVDVGVRAIEPAEDGEAVEADGDRRERVRERGGAAGERRDRRRPNHAPGLHLALHRAVLEDRTNTADRAGPGDPVLDHRWIDREGGPGEREAGPRVVRGVLVGLPGEARAVELQDLASGRSRGLELAGVDRAV